MATKTVTGIPEAIANLKKYQIIKTQAIKDRLKKQAFKVELAAKEMVAVDTGRLRASISTNWSGSSFARAKPKGGVTIGRKSGRKPNQKADDGVGQPQGPKDLVYIVGTNVDYGPSVEFNTSKRIGRPYLYPAYFMYEGETIMAIGKIMKEDVRLK